MNITKLTNIVVSVNLALQNKIKSAINQTLTIRNWLIGYYIVEYEQYGEDRAKYGENTLQELSARLNNKSFSYRSLKLYRQFYNCYPEIGQSLTAQFKNEIRQAMIAQFKKITLPPSELLLSDKNEILQAMSEQITKTASEAQIRLTDKIIQSLSFTHITLLLSLDSELKRAFYALEAIKGVWSVRELKRQINSLYFERSGLSSNKEKLSQLINQTTETQNPVHTLRNPMVFEFLDLPTNETLEESQLERALMDNLQHFLLELGYGFCFEARQKRILIDDEYFFIDLVFYHRILKSHVLVELKTEAFTHENIGQLNVYLQYFKQKEMHPGDKPPIGILLCTKSKPQMVRYALADKENMYVNQYKLQLPDENELQQFIELQLEEDND